MSLIEETNDFIKNIIKEFQGRVDFYRHASYLKKMGWTEHQYLRNTDQDVVRYANTVKDFYKGYTHIHVFETTRENPFRQYPTWMDAYQDMNKWCSENCKEKWRDDIHRVYSQTPIGLNGELPKEYVLSDIGGGDALFYAFKDSRDYTMFLLRWL